LLLIDFKVFSATIAPLFVRMLDMSASPLVGGLLCPVGMGAYPAIMSSDICDPLVSEPRHLLGACPMCPPKT